MNKWDVLLRIFFSEVALAASIFQNAAESWSAKYYCVAVPKMHWLVKSQQSRSDNASLLLYDFTLDTLSGILCAFELCSWTWF